MPENSTPDASRNIRRDHSSWNCLLAVPVVLPLLTPLHNREDPHLFGFPPSTGCSWRSC